jgi:beta-galactosidase
VLLGSLDRRLDQSHLPVDLKSGTQLDILVENTGRVNFSLTLRGERKGILGSVTLAGATLDHWQNFSLPMNAPGDMTFTDKPCTGACFYRGTLKLSSAQDTFLDTSQFAKGFVWLNGHPLGRVWSIGPQKTLYVPGPWLHAGDNDVIVFDLQGSSKASLQGLPSPVLNAPVQKSLP